MKEETKPYLEYLDKEMAIMGVLSAFAVAAPGLVLSQMAGAGETSALGKIWLGNRVWLIAGSASLLVSGLFFYRQRSLLAYYYGQICLALVPDFKTQSRNDWLREADSWATWLHYRWAFGFMLLGFVLYGVTFAVPGGERLTRLPLWVLPILVTFTLVACGIQSVVLTRLSYSIDPWAVARRYVRKRIHSFRKPTLSNSTLQPTSRAQPKSKTQRDSRTARG